MGILNKQIAHLNLDVNVAWIGPHLPSFVHDRTSQNMPTLFFNWLPNTLTSLHNYTRVKFPTCKSHDRDLNVDCDFELQQLSKLSWSRIKTHIPEAYHLITKMFFTQNDYEDLLRSYVALNGNAHLHPPDINATACHWVRNNRHMWEKWLPIGLTQKPKIYIGGMFPITGPYLREPGIFPG